MHLEDDHGLTVGLQVHGSKHFVGMIARRLRAWPEDVLELCGLEAHVNASVRRGEEAGAGGEGWRQKRRKKKGKEGQLHQEEREEVGEGGHGVKSTASEGVG